MCGEGYFACDGGCLLGSVKCNGKVECMDHSDETDCPRKFLFAFQFISSIHLVEKCVDLFNNHHSLTQYFSNITIFTVVSSNRRSVDNADDA